MDYPANVQRTGNVAIVALFTAAIVASDLALSGPEFSNIKLLDTLVFVSAYVFGFRVGASVGILSETIWSFLAPIGMAGVLTPFLVGGELLFAAAGWGASRLWGPKPGVATKYSVFIGALLAICAFVWDLETNFGTALVQYWPALPLPQVLGTMFNPATLIFALAHEGSDFAFGSLVAPSFILLIPKAFRRGP
jgi:uncharacterized membrane protein